MVEMKIFWLKPALDDLRKIRAYYTDNAGLISTGKRIRKITESISCLSANPFLGKEAVEIKRPSQQYRYLVCGDYKVFYYIKNNVVKIAMLWDCRQNPIRLIDKFK